MIVVDASMNAFKQIKETFINREEPTECDPDVCVICREYHNHQREPLKKLVCLNCHEMLIHPTCFQIHIDNSLSDRPAVDCPLCHKNFISFQVTPREFRIFFVSFMAISTCTMLFHLLTPLLYMTLSRHTPVSAIGYCVYIMVFLWHMGHTVTLTRQLFHLKGTRLGVVSEEYLPIFRKMDHPRLINPDPTQVPHSQDVVSVKRVMVYYTLFKTWGFWTIPAWCVLIPLRILGIKLPTSPWIDVIIIYFPVTLQCTWVVIFVVMALVAILAEFTAIFLIYIGRWARKIRIRQSFLKEEVNLMSRLSDPTPDCTESPGSPISIHDGLLTSVHSSSATDDPLGESFQTASTIESSIET